MKKIIIAIATIIALSSCSKTLSITDGVIKRDIKIKSNTEILFHKYENKDYIQFSSERGTKYNFPIGDYSLVIK